MATPGRLILPGALVVGALVALLQAGCAPRPTGAAAVILGSDLRLLPAESVGLAVLEVKSLRDQEAAGRWMEDFARELGATPALERVQDLLGQDSVKKVDRLALALVPLPGGQTGYAVLVEGDFDEAKVRALTGGEAILTMLEVAGRPDMSLTALPKSHLALGPRAVLEGMRRNLDHPDAGFLKSSLVPLLDKVKTTSQVWGAIDYAPLAALARDAMAARGSGVPLPSPTATSTLRAVAFEGRIDQAIDFNLFGEADAEKGARQLTDAARGLVALARMGASQKGTKETLDFLDGLRIDQSGSEIQVHGTMSVGMARAVASGLAARAGS
jgi:hypothetical protein